MRLKDWAVPEIKRLVAETYADDAVVRLFGSQLDDSKRGGDIDLMVEVDPARLDPAERWARHWRLQERLSAVLEERKVDLVLQVRGEPVQPIAAIAYRDGVVL